MCLSINANMGCCLTKFEGSMTCRSLLICTNVCVQHTWNFSTILIGQARDSKIGLQHQLIRYDVSVDTNTANQSFTLSVNGFHIATISDVALCERCLNNPKM